MPIPIYMKALLWSCYLISLFFAIFWFLVLLDGSERVKTKKLKKYPFVSIAVPAYNEEKRILKTLSSLTSLSYPGKKLEIIVINDGSTDKTRLVVERFIKQNKTHDIRLISKQNQGKGAALNDSLKIAKGEFFVCLDADSIVTRNALEKILPHFTANNIAVVLPMLKVYKPKNIWQKLQWIEYLINLFYKGLMGSLNCVHVSPGPFSVYRTAILKKVKGFDEGNLTEDLEITLRLQSRNFKIVQLAEPDVYTLAPESFRQLYKQRNRWYRGSVLNVIKYRHMMFNKAYGDFGMMQMPTILVSGIVAIILILSAVYYGLKPYAKTIYHSVFIDFDFYTLISNLKFDFSYLDINYMAILVAVITLSISIVILRKSHKEAKEKISRHGIMSLVTYLFFYFFVIGFIWVGIILDILFKKKQKW